MSTIENENKQISSQGKAGDIPAIYDKDYGHQFEEKLAAALKEKLSDIVEETELATPNEDVKQKVDIWIKFRGIADPVGVQVTFTSSDRRMEKKESDIDENPLVKKERRPDALIGAPRNCDKVLVFFDKNQVKTGKIIDKRILAGTLRQIMAGLPNQSKMLFVRTIGDRMKKAGKRFPA